MANQSEAKREWREATPDDSDKGSSSSDGGEGGEGSGSDGTTSYESEELTPRPAKKVCGEEENDPVFDPVVEKKVLTSSHAP
jgi:hypothetical protein